ncbi:MAG: hypothetical protein JKY65_30800 [Planctomycetes bacterium]|nr:hypothetical protein [Planctomycetota bacterium]
MPNPEGHAPKDPAVHLPPLVLDLDGLTYSLTTEKRKTIVHVRHSADPDEPGFTDRVDLIDFRRRQRLARDVADSFGREDREILGHLTVLLDAMERASTAEPEEVKLTAERRRAAIKLLRRGDLLERAAKAMEAVGHVGEPNCKRIGYLVATSRLLPRPLSAILRAPSGCGKSQLLEAVEALVPPESVSFLSRLTPQALFYAGPNHLKHKLVLVDEQAGASDADYSIRTLQSKGFLTLQSPGKPPTRVEGPIALMSGTTSADLNPENLSRCLELSLDDSPAQTERVQEAQRQAWAGKRRTSVDVQLWQDAQRLLEALPVVIPFAERLRFPARSTHDRRGNEKLLGLVASHALLHQLQRERDAQGQVVAIPADYAAVHGLLQPVLAAELDELSPRAAQVYRCLIEAGEPLARRDVAKRLRCGYNTAKRALADLLAQELVATVSGRAPTLYRVLDASVLGTSAKLLKPEALA